MSNISRFKVDISHLAKTERETLKILEKVGEWCHKIWEKQINCRDQNTPFYADGVSKEELVEAARRNPRLLSPYTVVKRDEKRRLVAINYRDEYKREIDRICELLDKASKTTADRSLSLYLKKISSSFKKGDFNSSLVAYLQNRNTKIEVLIGPIESYNDTYMGIKKSFQFSLRVLRDGETEEVEEMLELANKLGILRPSESSASRLKSDRIRIRVDDVVMFAGRQAGSMPSSTNLPNEPELVDKYGVKIILYHNAMFVKYNKQLKPLLKYVKDFDVNRTKNSMAEANYRITVLHEIVEGTVKFKNMVKRLGRYIDVLREMNAETFGLRSAKYHVLNGLISVEQYNEIIVQMLLFGIDVCHRGHKDLSVMIYARGYHVVLNYLLSKDAIQLRGGKIKIDFAKVSAEIDILSSIVVSLLEEGTEEEAERLFSQWGDESIVDKLPKA